MKRSILAMVLALASGAAFGRIAGQGWPRAESSTAMARDHFRVTCQDVIRDESLFVVRVGVETETGARVRIVADKPDRGGFNSSTSGMAGPNRLDRTELTIVGDHAEWTAGAANVLRFLMKFDGNLGHATMSNTGPMPNGKKLADVLRIDVKPGEFRSGSLPLVRFQDVTYSLVVERPE